MRVRVLRPCCGYGFGHSSSSGPAAPKEDAGKDVTDSRHSANSVASVCLSSGGHARANSTSGAQASRPQRAEPLRGVLELEDEAGPSKARSVYLVTLPHPKQTTTAQGQTLVAPGSKTRKQILQIFLECCADPIYVGARARQLQLAIPIAKTGVFRELHAEDANGIAEPHDHLPVKGGRDFMYKPVRTALLERHGLASHWGCSHTGYWSPIRYLYYPSPKKPLAPLDKQHVLWAPPPAKHPPLDECCHEPTTAAAISARREKTDLKAAEASKPAARITEVDVWPIVVQHNIRNTHDDVNGEDELMALAVDHASIPMRDFLFKSRGKLNALIDR